MMKAPSSGGVRWLALGGLACTLACSSATRHADEDAVRDADTAGEVDCDALTEALVVAFEEAVLCDPAISSPQCDGAEMVNSRCGCPWAANNRQPDLAQAARDSWGPYEAAGCVPETCGPCREPTPSFRCVPLPIGTEGTCEVVD